MKPGKGRLKSLMTGKHSELEALFAEYSEYSATIPFEMYNVKEILSEKIRALLTREGIKARDFIDIFFIYKKTGIKPEDVEKCVISKTNFALENFERYRTNLAEKEKLLNEGKLFEWGSERDLLLTEPDEKEFNGFIDEFTEYLKVLVKKLQR